MKALTDFLDGKQKMVSAGDVIEDGRYDEKTVERYVARGYVGSGDPDVSSGAEKAEAEKAEAEKAEAEKAAKAESDKAAAPANGKPAKPANTK